MATFTSIDALTTFVQSLPTPAIIGIAGAPGAGKSTIAEALVTRLPNAALLPMDGFHLPQARLVELGRRDRMGAPDTFDVDGFIGVLRDLEISGGPVFAPGFDRTIEEPVPDAIVIQPTVDVVVVEGNYLLLDDGPWAPVAALLDATFVVTIDEAVRHQRLIARHIRYGKSEADARAWALGPDEANAVLIAASAGRADHVIALR